MLDMRNEGDAQTHKPSLVGGAYEALKDAIRNNVFAPGYQGSEQEIASQLGMSRTPVHEAIIRLQEEGLVRVLPRRGVVVCAISPEDMREIYEVIIALETASAELLAEKPDDERRPVRAATSLTYFAPCCLSGDYLTARFASLPTANGHGAPAALFS